MAGNPVDAHHASQIRPSLPGTPGSRAGGTARCRLPPPPPAAGQVGHRRSGNRDGAAPGELLFHRLGHDPAGALGAQRSALAAVPLRGSRAATFLHWAAGGFEVVFVHLGAFFSFQQNRRPFGKCLCALRAALAYLIAGGSDPTACRHVTTTQACRKHTPCVSHTSQRRVAADKAFLSWVPRSSHPRAVVPRCVQGPPSQQVQNAAQHFSTILLPTPIPPPLPHAPQPSGLAADSKRDAEVARGP